MSKIEALENIPEISFIDDISIEDVRNEILADYAEEYAKITGEQPDIAQGSPVRLIAYAFAAQIYQAYRYIDRAGKMNLLKYSEENFLDNLGAFKKITRLPASQASVTLKFSMSSARGSVTGIPGGTRVKSADKYFYTAEYAEIPVGETSVTVTGYAAEAGEGYNGVASGSISRIVDPVPYISDVTNINASSGGSDTESDGALTFRIYNAPHSYSVAGPAEAYKYHALQARADIEDVFVYTPEACKVTVCFLLSGGTLPDAAAIKDVEDYLKSKEIRPLTDLVTATAPTEKSYTIRLLYYINRSDSASAAAIQTAVNEAVFEYKKWQRKIGRDINPSELIRRIMAAGAKRVAVAAPVYAVVGDSEIASCTASVVTYGGLEDD